jgi:hypothetical protein
VMVAVKRLEDGHDMKWARTAIPDDMFTDNVVHVESVASESQGATNDAAS